MKFKLFHNIIQYNSMLSLLLSPNTKRCLTHYFGARINSPSIQRKGSKETIAFYQSIKMWGNTVSQERGEGTRFAFTFWKGAAASAQSKALPAWVAVFCSPLGRQAPALVWSSAARGQSCLLHEFATQEQEWEVKIPGAAWGMTPVLLQDQGFPTTGMGVLGQQFLWITCGLEVQHNHME